MADRIIALGCSATLASNRPMLGRRREISLQVSIAAIFVLLILPALGLVIAFSYHQNARNLRSLSDRFIDRARDEAITAATNFLAPVGATLRLVAEMAGTRARLLPQRGEPQRPLQGADLGRPDRCALCQLRGRLPPRGDAHRCRPPAQRPAHPGARQLAFELGRSVRRQPIASAIGPSSRPGRDPIGGYDVDSDFDPRTLTHYRMAKVNNTLGIADPTINPDTGYPIISLGYPIHVDGKFVGAASANITLTMMSHFLDTHRASRNSITVIAHRLGDVIAHPIEAHGVRHEGGKIQVTTLTELDEPQVVEAVHQRGRRLGRDRFTFDSQGQEYIAEFAGFPSDFGKDWEVLVVTPTDDFVGGLKETNRKLLWMMAGLALVESVLIYFMARRLSRPIEIVSDAIQGIRRLAFPERLPTGSTDPRDRPAGARHGAARQRAALLLGVRAGRAGAAADRFRASRCSPASSSAS